MHNFLLYEEILILDVIFERKPKDAHLDYSFIIYVFEIVYLLFVYSSIRTRRSSCGTYFYILLEVYYSGLVSLYRVI